MKNRYAGRFSLLKQLGMGGMGEVFLAVDLHTGAEYALKRLTLGPDGPGADLLRSEFEALARIRHPAVVRVVEFGFDFQNAPFLVMEFVPGWPADRAVRSGDWNALAEVAARVTAGLEALHAAGVAHGDLKPGNVLVGPPAENGRARSVKLVDFGLAALAGRAAAGHRGTPGYTAPEVVAGGAPDAAADLYALGATLFTLAAGRAPFEADDAQAALRRQQTGPPSALPLEEAGVPAGWVRLILQLMATAPAERPRSAADVRRAIEQLAPATRQPLVERLAAQTTIGRHLELSRLERAWRHARRGARTVLVTGAAGIGKSALLDAFATRGALAGRSVMRVSGAAGGEPASAWRAVALRFAAEARLESHDLPEDVRAALAPGAGEPDEAVLARVTARIGEWSRAIGAAREGPPCVLMDDADALDPVSARALRRAMLSGEAAPALWVFARRAEPGELPEEDRLLVNAGAAEWLTLEPLDREAVAALAASRLGAEAPAALVDFLWDRAAGHAGLSVEALHAAAESGALRDEDVGLRVDADRLEAVPPAADFEAAKLVRFRALAEDARRAARTLAVRGAAIPLESLRRIDGSLGERALAALAEQGLASRDPEGRWMLSPPAIAARLQAETPAEELRALHAAIVAAGELSPRETFAHRRGAGDRAGALEAAEGAFQLASDPTLATEAAELAAPEDPRAAARWLERAARAWMDRGRYAKAAPLVERALTLDPEPAARPDRWSMLTTCRFRSGDLDGVERAAADAKREPLTDRALAAIQVDEAARLSSLGRTEDALRLAREAAALAEKAEAWTALGAARLTEGTQLNFLGRRDEASQVATHAEAAYRRSGNPLGVFRATGLASELARLDGRLADAEARLRSARSDAERQHVRFAAEDLAGAHAGVLTAMGRWLEAREAQQVTVTLGLEDGRASNVAVSVSNLALLDGLMGNLLSARYQANRALRLARAHSPQALGIVERIVAGLLLASGRLRAARRWCESALSGPLAIRAGDERDWCLINLARLEARLHRWARVFELAQAPLLASRRNGAVADVSLAVCAGRAAIRLEGPDAAEKFATMIEAWPNSGSGRYAIALTSQLRAEIELARGGSKKAVELADQSLERFANLIAIPDRAAAAFDFARLGWERGMAETAAIPRWLDEAISGFERLGDHRTRERALGLNLKWHREHRPVPERSGERGNLIQAVGRLLDSMPDFQELVQQSMRLAVEQLRAERGLLLLMDPETGKLEPRAEHGALDAAAKRGATEYSRGAVARVAESGGSLLIEDALTDGHLRSKSILTLGLRSILCVPLFRGGRVVGAVYLDDSRQGAFSEADRGLLEGFAQLMAIAIENSRGADEVRRANEQLVGENLSLRLEMETRFQPSGFIGTSEAMRRVLAVVERASQVSATVLLTGENGTGKEKIARVLHHSGRRRGCPFVALNCGAIPEQLLESELFGHMRGSFSGATRDHKGAFERAAGGTLFLDEIGEMTPSSQVKLLAVLANREVTPVGGERAVPVDVRVVAATNQDLRRRITEGQFRVDLFYRLNVIPIELPPLRERKADIPQLARHFVEHFAQLQERETPELSPEFLAAVMQSDWPGNVRELQNYIERVLAMTPGPVLRPVPPPRDLEERAAAPSAPKRGGLSAQLAEFERRAIREALERAGGNQSQAARELKLKEQTLRYRMRKHDLAEPRKKQRTRKKRR